jgi:hypothetical protein
MMGVLCSISALDEQGINTEIQIQSHPDVTGYILLKIGCKTYEVKVPEMQTAIQNANNVCRY